MTSRPGAAAARRWSSLSGAILALAVAGCGTTGKVPVQTETVPFTTEQKTLYSAASNAHYRLQVGDSFAVIFKYQEELNQHHISILPDGRFSMAGFEDVYGLGLTIPQLDSLMTVHFSRDYRNAELSVIMEEFGKRYIHVLGEVRLPSTYQLPAEGSAGILEAIALAGGFTKDAKPSATVIIRVTDQGWQYRHCDLSHLEKDRFADLGYLDLRSNDIVYVPRSAWGDWDVFTERVLPRMVNLTSLFWDVYAATHIDKLGVVTR